MKCFSFPRFLDSYYKDARLRRNNSLISSLIRCLCLLSLFICSRDLAAQGGQDSWETIAEQERESWRYSKEGDAYPPAESAPTQGSPTQYHEFAGMFKPFIGHGYDLKDVMLSGVRISFHDYVLRAFQEIYSSQGDRPVPSAIKDLLVPLVALADEAEIHSFLYFARGGPTLPPSPPPTTRQVLLEALRVVGLRTRVYPDAIFVWPKENVVSSIRALTSQFFTRLRTSRGASLTDIFVLSILADPYLAELLLIYPREVNYRSISSQADIELARKTTPSLAFNNKAANIIYQRIPWENLGMQHYDNFKGFFPWATMQLAENYYTHREMYEVAEFTPVIGTMLSLVDGLTTMYEGKDYYGTPANRVWTGAFLALDAIDLAFTGGTAGAAAVKPAKFLRLQALTKEIKLMNFPKTRSGSLQMLSKLRRVLTEAMSSPGTSQVCRLLDAASPALAGSLNGARASLDPNTAPLYGGQSRASTQIQGCIKGAIDTSQNMILDTNILLPILTWKKLKKTIVKELKLRHRLGQGDPKYQALLKTYIVGQIFSRWYDDFHLVLTESSKYETSRIIRLFLNDLGLSAPDGFTAKALLEEFFTNKMFEADFRHLAKTDSQEAVKSILQRFGLGDEIKDGALHPGTKDQSIVLQGLLADRLGYAEEGAVIKPLFFTSDKNFFSSLALLGGHGVGRGVNLADSPSFKTFANSLLGELDGVPVKLATENVVDAFNEQLAVGNRFINGVPNPVRSMDDIGGRDISNLSARTTLIPCSCDDLNKLVKQARGDDPRLSWYKNLIKEIAPDKYNITVPDK